MALPLKTVTVTTAFSRVTGTPVVVEHDFPDYQVTLTVSAEGALIVKVGGDVVLIYAPNMWVSALGAEA